MGGVRYRNERNLALYAASVGDRGEAIAETDRLRGEKAAREAAVLLLRTREGIIFSDYIRRYGPAVLEEIRGVIRREVPLDCYREEAEGLYLTKKGMRVANAVWSAII